MRNKVINCSFTITRISVIKEQCIYMNIELVKYSQSVISDKTHTKFPYTYARVCHLFASKAMHSYMRGYKYTFPQSSMLIVFIQAHYIQPTIWICNPCTIICKHIYIELYIWYIILKQDCEWIEVCILYREAAIYVTQLIALVLVMV